MKKQVWILGMILAAQAVCASTVWQPDPAKAGPVQPEQVRIIKMGLEHNRTGDGNAFAINSYHRYRVERGASGGLWKKFVARDDVRELRDIDVDGDGDVKNDRAGFHPFSMDVDRPMTPTAPWYDTSVGSQRFYGGGTLLQANAGEGFGTFSEDGMNDAEEGAFYQPRRNWTFFQ